MRVDAIDMWFVVVVLNSLSVPCRFSQNVFGNIKETMTAWFGLSDVEGLLSHSPRLLDTIIMKLELNHINFKSTWCYLSLFIALLFFYFAE